MDSIYKVFTARGHVLNDVLNSISLETGSPIVFDAATLMLYAAFNKSHSGLSISISDTNKDFNGSIVRIIEWALRANKDLNNNPFAKFQDHIIPSILITGNVPGMTKDQCVKRICKTAPNNWELRQKANSIINLFVYASHTTAKYRDVQKLNTHRAVKDRIPMVTNDLLVRLIEDAEKRK